jgi:hypothetical protein
MFKHQWKIFSISIVTILTTLVIAISPIIFNANAIAQQGEPTPSPTPTAAPVTSVSQLKDVTPTEPYFPALQSLVERYGCVALPSDGYFKPTDSLNRGDAAILVHSCLVKMAELIQDGAIKPPAS